jgi:hypothetical protein
MAAAYRAGNDAPERLPEKLLAWSPQHPRDFDLFLKGAGDGRFEE